VLWFQDDKGQVRNIYIEPSIIDIAKPVIIQRKGKITEASGTMGY
jgi:hypothetical protein